MQNNPENIILWIDDHALVVNKPAGLTTLPDGYDPGAPHLKSILEPSLGPLWIVHRLDRYTSGVILLARSPYAHKSFNTQFESRGIVKIYHAVVSGRPAHTEFDIQLPLRADGDRRHRTVVDHHAGKDAHTHIHILERYASSMETLLRSRPLDLEPAGSYEWALVGAIPKTGRTHQIRAHLAAVGLPIVGDILYGGESLYLSQLKPGYRQKEERESPLLERQALHANAITFKHPETGNEISVTAPYPKDLIIALRQMRKHGLLT